MLLSILCNVVTNTRSNLLQTYKEKSKKKKLSTLTKITQHKRALKQLLAVIDSIIPKSKPRVFPYRAS